MAGSRTDETLRARLAVWSRVSDQPSGATFDDLLRFVETEAGRDVRADTALRNVSHATVAFERAVGPLDATQRLRMADLRDTIRRRRGAEPPRRHAVALSHAQAVSLFWREPHDRGLCVLMMFIGGMRFSDITRVRACDVRVGSFVEVTLRATKTSTYSGEPRTVAMTLPPTAIAFLQRRVSAATTPLFTLSYQQLVRFLQRTDPALTAHSPRQGFVQAALDEGVDDADVMRVTGHQSLRSLANYAGRLPTSWLRQSLRATDAVSRRLPI